MPIMKCKMPNGDGGYKYGESGKCYKHRADALKQMRAMMSSEKFHEEAAKAGLLNDPDVRAILLEDERNKYLNAIHEYTKPKDQ